MSFNIFDKFNQNQLDQLDTTVSEDNREIVISFDGGDTYEGWCREWYSITDAGLTFEAWESGGYQKDRNIEPRPAIADEIAQRLLKGELPLPRWSTRRGFEFINEIMNLIPADVFEQTKKKLLEQLMVCTDIVVLRSIERILNQSIMVG